MKPRILTTAFSSVYPLRVKKAERKGCAKSEVDTVICWLTGYDDSGMQAQIEKNIDYEAFFNEAPQINLNAMSRAPLKRAFIYSRRTVCFLPGQSALIHDS